MLHEQFTRFRRKFEATSFCFYFCSECYELDVIYSNGGLSATFMNISSPDQCQEKCKVFTFFISSVGIFE